MLDTKDLLQRAAAEITRLRRENELMAARLQTFDSMMLLLHTEPRYQSQGMAPDIVWEINKAISD